MSPRTFINEHAIYGRDRVPERVCACLRACTIGIIWGRHTHENAVACTRSLAFVCLRCRLMNKASAETGALGAAARNDDWNCIFRNDYVPNGRIYIHTLARIPCERCSATCHASYIVSDCVFLCVWFQWVALIVHASAHMHTCIIHVHKTRLREYTHDMRLMLGNDIARARGLVVAKSTTFAAPNVSTHASHTKRNWSPLGHVVPGQPSCLDLPIMTTVMVRTGPKTTDPGSISQ